MGSPGTSEKSAGSKPGSTPWLGSSHPGALATGLVQLAPISTPAPTEAPYWSLLTGPPLRTELPPPPLPLVLPLVSELKPTGEPPRPPPADTVRASFTAPTPPPSQAARPPPSCTQEWPPRGSVNWMDPLLTTSGKLSPFMSR